MVRSIGSAVSHPHSACNRHSKKQNILGFCLHRGLLWTLQVWEAAKVLAEHQAQDGIPEQQGSSDLLAPLRKPEVASQISCHEGCSTVFKLLMSAAEADLAHSISIGELQACEHSFASIAEFGHGHQTLLFHGGV